jgi:hypothetical protein
MSKLILQIKNKLCLSKFIIKKFVKDFRLNSVITNNTGSFLFDHYNQGQGSNRVNLCIKMTNLTSRGRNYRVLLLFKKKMNDAAAKKSQLNIEPPPKYVAGIFSCQQNATLKNAKEEEGRERLINNSYQEAVRIEFLE